jgi:hypothetical protein
MPHEPHAFIGVEPPHINLEFVPLLRSIFLGIESLFEILDLSSHVSTVSFEC